MTVERLRSLRSEGILDELYKGGLLSHRAYTSLEIALKVAAFQSSGMTHGGAVIKTATHLHVTRQTIYRALQLFETGK